MKLWILAVIMDDRVCLRKNICDDDSMILCKFNFA